MALLAEVIGAQPVILLGLLCRECTRVVLIFADGVPWMAAMQLAYAGGVAANTIYFAYIYSVVETDAYAPMTSLVLASYHTGNVLAALLAQLLVSSSPSIAADLTPLFYLSWLFTSLGTLAFLLLPPPIRKPPPALAHELLRHGPRATLRELVTLYRPRETHTWLVWWCLGVSGQAIVLNYFQLQLSETSETTAYGLLEAAVEMALVVGSLLAAPLAQSIRQRPAAFIAASSAGRAAAYALAAWGASRRWEVLPWVMNVAAAALCSMQQAAGSAIVAKSLVGSNRYALLFSVNTLLANGVAAAMGNVGAALGSTPTATTTWWRPRRRCCSSRRRSSPPVSRGRQRGPVSHCVLATVRSPI